MPNVGFHGIIPPVLTLFNEDGSIDWEGNKKLIDFLIGKKVHALFFLGSAGEFTQMTFEERKQFAEFAVKYVDGRLPVIVGTGSCSTSETIKLTEHAKAIGANGVAVVTPYYWNLSDEEMYDHFAQVARSVDIPIIIYNIPMTTGQNISPSLIARLAKSLPNIIGIKDTVDSISHIRQIIAEVKAVKPEFSVLTGFDDHILSTLMLGGDGAITGFSNSSAEINVGIYESFAAGDLTAALAWNRKIQRVNSLFTIGESLTGMFKEAAKQVVGVSPSVRAPLHPCSPAGAEKINQVLKEVGLVNE